MLTRIWRRLAHRFSRHKFERELEDEMRLHRELRAAKLRDAGIRDTDAVMQAQRKFGNMLLTKEASRDIWGWRALDSLLQDLGYALRQMRMHPGFSAVVVATLALGIGANTAIFAVFEAVILRSLPVPDPQELRLVQISVSGSDSLFSQPLFLRMRDALPSGSELAAMTRIERAQLVTPGSPAESASIQLVSGSFFETVKVAPALGRLFTMDDDRSAGTDPVAVVSHRYWTRRWSATPDVLGQIVTVNGQALTIIGVTARGFLGTRAGDSADVWIPLAMQANVRHSNNQSSYGSADSSRPWFSQENIFWLELIARVPKTIDAASVVGSLNVMLQRTMTQIFGNEPNLESRRRHLAKQIVLAAGDRGAPGIRQQLFQPLNAALAMSGLVLLIACANLASLMISRSESRQREIAVRMSIGASRGRLVRQLFTESLLLGVAGSLVGAFIGVRLGPELLRLLGGPSILDLSPNLTLYAFSASLCLLTTVAFGLIPALRTTQIELSSSLKVSGSIDISGGRLATGKAMIAAQIALSVVLLVCAGLLSRTLYNLSTANSGYSAAHLLAVNIDPNLGRYSPAELLPLYQRLQDRLNQLPGVQSVAIAHCTLASGGGCGQYSDMYAEGFVPARGQGVQAQEIFTSWNYLPTMGMTLLRGRGFTEQDRAGSRRVVIVNQTLARHYFGHDDVVGKRLGYDPRNANQFEIVGVLQDIPINNFRERVPRFVLHPVAQESRYLRTINIRAQGDPAVLASAVRSAIGQLEPRLPIYNIRTMAEQLQSTFAQERAIAWLSRLFSALAVGLVCLGLYGLLSYRVSRRTAEIGIRMAVGARSSTVRWMIIRDALHWTAGGLLGGMALSLAVTRSLRSLLFGISPADPLTYAAVVVLLVTVILAASLIPAQRASRIDPMIALRVE